MTKNTKKVLIAEDDTFLVKIISSRLSEEGYDVTTANDGEEALKAIDSNDFAVMMLDLMMPKKDGFEVLKELKEKGNKVPVLVFSNLSQSEDKEEAKSLGAKGFFVKSDISTNEIVETVNKFAK